MTHGGVEDENVGDPLTDQAEGRRQPALPAADDDDVVEVTPAGIGTRQHPLVLGIDQDLQVAPDARVQRVESLLRVGPQRRPTGRPGRVNAGSAEKRCSGHFWDTEEISDVRRYYSARGPSAPS